MLDLCWGSYLAWTQPTEHQPSSVCYMWQAEPPKSTVTRTGITGRPGLSVCVVSLHNRSASMETMKPWEAKGVQILPLELPVYKFSPATPHTDKPAASSPVDSPRFAPFQAKPGQRILSSWCYFFFFLKKIHFTKLVLCLTLLGSSQKKTSFMSPTSWERPWQCFLLSSRGCGGSCSTHSSKCWASEWHRL